MTDIPFEEDILNFIENDDLQQFQNLLVNYPDWENHYLKDEEEYFIHFATRKRSLKILTFLVENNYNINKRDNKNQNILHIALEIGFCELISIFSIKNIEIDLGTDSEGNNLLHKCIMHTCMDLKCMKYLLSLKCDWLESNKFSVDIFHQSVIQSNYESFNYLVSYFKPQQFKLGFNGNTILHLCCIYGSEKILNFLIENYKIDLHSLNDDRESCVTLSIINKKLDVLNRLLIENARIIEKDVQYSYENCNSVLYLKVKNEFERQKFKSRNKEIQSKFKKQKVDETLLNKNTISSRPTNLQNYGKRNLENFININVNINQKKVTNDKINMNINIQRNLNELNKSKEKFNSLNKSKDKHKMNKSQEKNTELNKSKDKYFELNKSKEKFNKNQKSREKNEDRNKSKEKQPLPIYKRKLTKNLSTSSMKNLLLNPDNQLTIHTIKAEKSNSKVNGRTPEHQKIQINASPHKLFTRTAKVQLARQFVNTTKNTINSNENKPNHVTTTSKTKNLTDSYYMPKDKASKFNIQTKQSNTEQIKSFQMNFMPEHYLSFLNLNPTDVEIGEKIYDADISEVYCGKYLTLPVAIKIYDISKLTDDNLTDFINEMSILMSLRHPNIVTLIGKCIYNNQFMVVTEYLERRALKTVLDNKKIDLSTKILLKMALDIARAVYYLHTRTPPVYHRDLKSPNCLVDEYFHVKLCDFGISKIFESIPGKTTSSYSSSFWMAPEYLNERIFTAKSDVYSFGILFWEIINRDTTPFKNTDNKTFLFGDETIKRRPVIKQDLDKNIANLFRSCWHQDPNFRPNMAQVVNELEKLILMEMINENK